MPPLILRTKHFHHTPPSIPGQTWVPVKELFDLGVSPSAMNLYMCLLSGEQQYGHFPTDAQLLQWTGWCKRTLHRRRRELKDAGLIIEEVRS